MTEKKDLSPILISSAAGGASIMGLLTSNISIIVIGMIAFIIIALIATQFNRQTI